MKMEQIKPDKVLLTHSKLKSKSKQLKTKKLNKKKLKNILNFEKYFLKPRTRHQEKQKKEDTSVKEDNVSLIVYMESSVDTTIPSSLENVRDQEIIIQNKEFNILSDLVSPVSFKKQNSDISRLPCNYKQYNKERLINPVSSNFTSVIEKCSIPGIEFHTLVDSEVMLVMTSPMLLYFNGSLKIQVLMGSVEVLGYLIDSDTDVQTVYSTKGSSYICLKAVTSEKSSSTIEYLVSEKLKVSNYLDLRMKYIDRKNVISALNEKSVVIILRKNNDFLYSEIWPKFLFKYCSFYSVLSQKENFFENKTRTFSLVENILNCLFEINCSNVISKEYKEPTEWNTIENEIISQSSYLSPKMVLVGGKGVGKSTLLRYIVNKCLRKWKKLLVLDFDIGQSEFTVPGCISAVLVDKPLLGANFTHLMDTLRSVFVGDVDAVQCLETYMEGFQQILHFCKQQPALKNIPWFVNTMGFCKDLGLSITTNIIQKISPTHVVQIYSHNKSRNFERKLKAEAVAQHRFGIYTTPFNGLKYTFLHIPSAAEEKNKNNVCSKPWGMSAKQSRQVVLFSYLSKMLTCQSVELLEITPFVIRISQLHLEVYHCRMSQKQALLAMNGNLVALCNKSNNEELPNCLGFGIVRGFDYNSDQLFLITPLNLLRLQAVNCLVKGNVFLPESFYLLSGDKVEGHVPYISYTAKSFTNQSVKREYNPNKSTAGSHIKPY